MRSMHAEFKCLRMVETCTLACLLSAEIIAMHVPLQLTDVCCCVGISSATGAAICLYFNHKWQKQYAVVLYSFTGCDFVLQQDYMQIK